MSGPWNSLIRNLYPCKYVCLFTNYLRTQRHHYGNRQTSIKRMEKQEKIGCLLFSFLSHKVAPRFGHPQLTPAAMKQVALMVDGKAHILCDCHSAIVNSLGQLAALGDPSTPETTSCELTLPVSLLGGGGPHTYTDVMVHTRYLSLGCWAEKGRSL